MSGFQEILVIVFIIFAIVFIPRMTGRGPDERPPVRSAAPLSRRLSGRMRLAIALCIGYVMGAAAFLKPWRGDIDRFLLVGVGPVALAAGIAWVVAGFRKDRSGG